MKAAAALALAALPALAIFGGLYYPASIAGKIAALVWGF